MATYREIQSYLRKHNNFAAQTCWIADVLADHGLTTRIAANRIDPVSRAKPCPADKRPHIVAALRHFAMI